MKAITKIKIIKFLPIMKRFTKNGKILTKIK